MKQSEIKETPWTSLGVMVDINEEILTRNVLFEKYNFKKAKEAEMKEFFISKINGCELYLNSEYSDYIFYVKNKEILIERDEKNKTFYIKYGGLWQKLETHYGLNYSEVQSFTKVSLEYLLKSQGYKTLVDDRIAQFNLEDLLKSQGYKTKFAGYSFLDSP